MKEHPAQRATTDAALNETPETEHLEFPVVPDFLSLPPRLDPQAMLQRLEETMPWRSTRPGEAERRSAAKIDVEFVL